MIWMLEKQCDGKGLQGVSKVKNSAPLNVTLQNTKGAHLIYFWVFSREKQNKNTFSCSCFLFPFKNLGSLCRGNSLQLALPLTTEKMESFKLHKLT